MSKKELFILFQHSTGYAIFKVNEFEEISEIESSFIDLSSFKEVVSLVGFSRFKHAKTALEGMHAMSEGAVPEDLILFMKETVPKSSKKSSIILGVADPKLGAVLAKSLGVSYQSNGAVLELIRGIRFHFPNLIEGFTNQTNRTATLCLAHSYSTAKVKFNDEDRVVISRIRLLDYLNVNINTFATRLSEMYSYHFPELIKIVPDYYLYAKLVYFIADRNSLNAQKLDKLEGVVMDRELAGKIISAAGTSIGMDIDPSELVSAVLFAKKVISEANYIKDLTEGLKEEMSEVAPNLSSLVGDQVGARLIAHAGSLRALTELPASAVQILGAEKSLFRALKTRRKTPKHGLIFQSPLIARAPKHLKGRISRYLANKCLIASRIDCFSEQRTNVFGEKMRQQVEDKLKFYETGHKPETNVDVMRQAIKVNSMGEKKIKKRKIKEEPQESGETIDYDTMQGEKNTGDKPKKKKSRRKRKEQEAWGLKKEVS